MKPVLFISDLHLSPERSAVNRLFHVFLNGPARAAEALYVLGDLFDSWAGDDDLDDPFNREMVAALGQLTGHGVVLYVMHGNRDLLMGERFAAACRAVLLPDPTLTHVCRVPTLLMHGDTLCTDDAAYQAFRAQVRDPAFQAAFLAKPLAERKAFIGQLRSRSEAEKGQKPAEIMDVNPGAVEAELRRHGFPRLIHGHTHRPARHLHDLEGRCCERWVLPDWYERGGYLACDEGGWRLVAL
ncbi:MAG: UDP-2,3-diacylglucosamine diphosphatase [Betaproteobacteria bacterium]|nr:UDP-2,3-diacylglucosamine diphosphatase [Betaproteobacteria bacterium]